VKRVLILFLLPLLLSACGNPAAPAETVTDVVLVEDLTASAPCRITLAIPDGAQLQPEEGAGMSRYLAEDGDFCIDTGSFLAYSPDSAIRQLTGFDRDELDIITTRRFGLPEYRMVWCQTENGCCRVSRASLVEDGQRYYAVVFSAPESSVAGYSGLMREVFASFGLCAAEAV